MKALAVVLISLIATNTHASWMATKCSNSDGTVTWESGHDLNEINLKYANFVEGTLTLEMDKVNVEFSKEVTVSQKTIRTCTHAAHKRVYAGKVKITGSEKNPDVLRGQFPLNKVETEVICTLLVNNELPCPEVVE